jgi:N-acylneuraminate cytidylyltransferase
VVISCGPDREAAKRCVCPINILYAILSTFLGWQLEAAGEAKLVDEIFVSTECPLIKAEALKYGARIIERPKELAQAFTNHGDAIVHGAREARRLLGEDIGLVTILLGNTAMNRAEDIDACMEAVLNRPEADACMTVWRAQDDHPYRAMTVGPDGYLRSFLDVREVDTNRQSYPDVFYYDQGPWTVRYSVLMRCERGKTGPACWWWMGDKVISLERLWVTGKDVHSRMDVEISGFWRRQRLWEIEQS